jgi:mannose-6-phosphate isomerase-like protein (cupin superfamily)
MSINEYQVGHKDTRPWGDWEVIAVGAGYAVKRIRVTPGGCLSLQTHRHRAEHWAVVAGVARVTNDGVQSDVPAGGAVDIGLGAKHRVENRGSEDVVLIEIQRGEILREDDIERHEDIYGRTA